MTSQKEVAERIRQLFNQLQATAAVRSQAERQDGKASAPHSAVKAILARQREKVGQQLKRLRRRLRQAVKRRPPG